MCDMKLFIHSQPPRLQRWSLEIDNGCNYWSMLRLKLIYFRGPSKFGWDIRNYSWHRCLFTNIGRLSTVVTRVDNNVVVRDGEPWKIWPATWNYDLWALCQYKDRRSQYILPLYRLDGPETMCNHGDIYSGKTASLNWIGHPTVVRNHIDLIHIGKPTYLWTVKSWGKQADD